MKAKLKAHLWTLPRWFAAPFFGSALLLGCLLSGGLSANAWLGFAGGLFVMAGGHAFNSYLDYAWTGLDVGEVELRSAEKDYCGGQNLIASGVVSLNEVLMNSILWYLLSAIPIMKIAFDVGFGIVPVWLAGMLVTFWYSKSKFNWTHELALGTGVGPVAVLMGMFSVSANPDWLKGVIISYPFAIILSFAGLALDEWPDAEANIKKGVKSIAYMVKIQGFDLSVYLVAWILFMYLYQVLMIAIGYLAPLTAIAWASFFPMMGCMVYFKTNYRRAAGLFVLFAAFYPVGILIGQLIGG